MQKNTRERVLGFTLGYTLEMCVYFESPPYLLPIDFWLQPHLSACLQGNLLLAQAWRGDAPMGLEQVSAGSSPASALVSQAAFLFPNTTLSFPAASPRLKCQPGGEVPLLAKK